ncbi:MAG: UPF0182 family protein [Deltaproteobacteria bacterium]|jgi:uncharacterized membrane protein (UPF0182 family)|nr:UPF0182 family protein [Deltaproteobacteria bacterium]MBW2482641.1 UPF0182 family protein [Deltaproteobacteria bacterium]
MNIKRVLILLAILVVIFIGVVIAFYPNWMWFKNLDFASVFWTMIVAKFGLAATIWFLMIVLLVVNLYIAQRLTPSGGQRATAEIGGFQLSGNTLDNLILAAILVVSFVIASRASEQWNMILSFLNQQPFGTNDPIFNKDIGFYVFSLPFYMFVREQLLILLLFAALVTVIWYIKDGGVQFLGEVLLADQRPGSLPKVKIAEKVSNHLLVLAGVLVILVALGYHLKVYGLLYSTQGPAFGASYTDVHVRIPAFRVLMVISLLWSIFLMYSAYRLNMKLLLISGGVWVIAILALGNGLPLLVQQFVVKPNELAKESAFIAHNIEFTRKAYNLNNIKEVDFTINEALSAEEVRGHDVTIQNIRVWDERPLLQTYRQIQAIRLYYDFNNMDVDRYMIDNTYRQVMLAARELVVNQLPPQANTWVNRHLIYTHGYGLAMSPVNEVTSEGLPQLMIKDLPPVSDIDLKIDRPEIYYGEKTDEYILVKTSTQEFDFPRGDKNVYTNYQGKGGVAIDSFLKRLLFAIEFQDPQILFTTYLTPESRIMFNRRVKGRVKAVAPFLAYDTDPYMVVSGGRLFWIQDAYTISNMYPYSKRSQNPFRRIGLNYIRNSVKVIIDAYNGDVSYYTIDEQDPILRTYTQIYPDLFKPLDQMPADLKKHLRYPTDKFEIQVQTYSRYHMQDIQVFYNQEDLWEPPDEIYGDKRQMMKPYYIIIKLPQEDKEEFLLMLPYTPAKKDNMIGWLAARSDMPNYGNLIVYKLPKDQLVYGPMQIEARVDQQTEISRELSLWDQRGSRVIRGNLLAIPISDAFIYVEPIYLEAKQEAQRPAPVPQSQSGAKPQKQSAARPARKGSTTTAGLPELKRIIVALGNRVVMEERLDRALNRVLGSELVPRRDVAAVRPETGEASDLSTRALDYYYKAKEYLREGDWAGYGRELDKLENILKQMSNTAPSSN